MNPVSLSLSLVTNSLAPLFQDYIDRFTNSYSDNPELPESKEDNWMNQCMFKCKKCPKLSQFSTRNKLALHLSNEHQTTLKDYIGKKKSIFSRLIKLTCKICDKTIRWDRDTITAHLDKLHSTTPSKYFEEHLKDNLDEILLGLRVSRPAANNGVKPCPTLKWSDKCKFACHVCYQVIGSKTMLKWHLANEHKMSGTYHSERCTSEVLTKVTHGCLICGQELLLDSSVLKKHLDSCHGKMSERDYNSEHYSKYVLNKPDTNWMIKSRYCCKACREIFAGKDRLKMHLTSHHSNSNLENGNGIFEEHFLTCLAEDQEQKTCSKKVVWDTAAITDHLSTHSMTPDEYHSAYYTKGPMLDKVVWSEQAHWMNKCSFLCKVCRKTFVTRTALSEHSKDSHSIEMGEQGSVVSDIVVNFQVHSCQVCSENILWEEGSLIQHLTAKHKIPLSEYFTSYMHQYSNNEECKKQVQEFDSWASKCLYRCVLCPDSPEIVQERTFDDHVRKEHPESSPADWSKIKKAAFVKTLSHVCQVCGVSVLWDIRSLSAHIEKFHRMKATIYRAMFMSDYTEDLKKIEQRQQERRRQAQLLDLSLPDIVEVDDDDLNSSLVSEETSLSETFTLDDDLGMTPEVKKWAQGCLYSCAICKNDIAGARPFELHLVSDHATTLSSYKQEHGANQACVSTNFHFCRLCCVSVRHDELDLKHHFEKEHATTVGNYFEMFRGKLRLQKLERPKSIGDNSSSELKRKRPVDANIDAKKKKTP